MRKKSLLLACCVALSLGAATARAENLLEVFEDATRSDPVIREAEARRLAALEAKPQARGVLFPQLSLGGEAYMGSAETQGFQRQFREVVDPVTGDRAVEAVAVPFENTTDTDAFWSYDAQVTQTLFRWDQWQRLKQADSRVALAEANYRAAQQDLMVRVAQRYFDVLAADDTLTAAEAALESVNRQLEQAEKRFEVGLIAITDVQEARAAQDSATAGVIAAKRALATSQEFLRELTGEAYAQLTKPAEAMPLDQPQPFDEQVWVDKAVEQNLNVVAARLGVDIAKSNVKIAQAGHMPTLDLYARYGDSASDATSLTKVPAEFRDPTVPVQEFPADLDRQDDQIGVRLNVPIYTGGVTRSQVREQTYLHRAERERLEGAMRGAEREARDSYLGVIAEKARVQALAQAVKSNQTALEATEAGFEVGTRTTVDVLDARRRLFEAQRDFARSRYDYLVNVVRLKSASGVLLPADLAAINTGLTQPATLPVTRPAGNRAAPAPTPTPASPTPPVTPPGG
jgi:outer membrane protein